MQKILVMSDLDGTLLDHHDYSHDAARPALRELARLGIPLILNSSKTASEMLPIRRELGNHDPFVVENGATLFVPTVQGGREFFECIIYGLTRSDILEALKRVSEDEAFDYRAFSGMSESEVAEVTGLSPEAAALALSRHFTEPLLWLDSEEALARFSARLEPFRVRTVRGGRFVHLGGGADKASCIPWLREHYRDAEGKPPLLIALGDSDNDLPMLGAADLAVLVANPVRPSPRFMHPRLTRTTAYGPKGWNAAVLGLLEKLTGAVYG